MQHLPAQVLSQWRREGVAKRGVEPHHVTTCTV